MANKVCSLIEFSGITEQFPENPLHFKQLSVQENLCIPVAKPDIEQIVSAGAEVVVTGTKVIKTAEGTSAEGQNLTGKKLIVEGVISQKVEYVADEPTQPVHAAHFNMPFSTFIVLPADYQGAPIIVTGYIEDIFVQLLSKRCLFKNITIFLDARY